MARAKIHEMGEIAPQHEEVLGVVLPIAILVHWTVVVISWSAVLVASLHGATEGRGGEGRPAAFELVVVAAIELVACSWDIGPASELAALVEALGWGATMLGVDLVQVPLDELVVDGS